MKRNNTRVTRSEQARAEAAAKRRAKRKQVRTALLAPLRTKLASKDALIAKLIEENQKLRLPVTEGPGSGGKASDG